MPHQPQRGAARGGQIGERAERRRVQPMRAQDDQVPDPFGAQPDPQQGRAVEAVVPGERVAALAEGLEA